MTRADPEISARIIALREAGHVVKDIAATVGVSVRTANRILRSAGAVKGSLLPAVRQQVVDSMVQTVADDAKLRELLAAIGADLLESISSSRARLRAAQEIIDKQPPTTPREYLELCRAESACATAGKLQIDTLRQLLSHAGRLTAADELPELIIKTMDADDVREVRRARALEDDLTGAQASALTSEELAD